MQRSLEDRLRALPGVLDCSFTDAGVVLLVHPEVDTRVLQARAHAVFAEVGDPRPLVLMGGPAPIPARRLAGVRFDATPLSLTLFAVLVLCLLALIPLAPRPGSGGGEQAAEAPLGRFEIASSLTPELFRPAAAMARTRRSAAAQPAPEPVAAEPAAVAEAEKGSQGRRPAPKPRPAPRRPVAASPAAVPPCTPGNSAEHRVAVKAPLPEQANGVACD